MERTEYQVLRYDGAIMFLPRNMREAARSLSKIERAKAEEIRLRIGRRPSIVMSDREVSFSENPVTKQDLDMILDIATQASAHSVRESVRAGFITVRGGYRIGLCGSTVVNDGQVSGFRSISSVAIRISREMTGISSEVICSVHRETFRSTLIVSSPGGGKTTLLRDMIRTLSNGDFARGISAYRISVVDERNEIAAAVDGTPQMDIGDMTDVLTGCPKAEGVMMLLRSMNPQILALDEITAPEDIKALESAANCGIRLLATAHADSMENMRERILYRGLLEKRIFENLIFIHKNGDERIYDVRRSEGEL